jgi:uncharacterized membrane protein
MRGAIVEQFGFFFAVIASALVCSEAYTLTGVINVGSTALA